MWHSSARLVSTALLVIDQPWGRTGSAVRPRHCTGHPGTTLQSDVQDLPAGDQLPPQVGLAVAPRIGVGCDQLAVVRRLREPDRGHRLLVVELVRGATDGLDHLTRATE